MDIPKNKNILHYLQEHNVHLNAPCNGQGTCGKCKVIFKDTSPLPIEEKLLTKEELSSFVRLACQRITTKQTTITIPPQKEHNQSDALYQVPTIFHPYLKMKKQGDHYNVYRNNIKQKERKNKQAYGLAIDIGTTTIALALLNLINGEIVHYHSFTNPQTAYGSDVISRIAYAKDEQKLSILSSLIRNKLDQEIKEILHKKQIPFHQLLEVTIAANTTMVYLLLNKDPSSLAQAPYKADTLNRIETTYEDVIGQNIDAHLTIFEGLDAFVGGDIVSGLISNNLHQSKEYNLFIDLGTNGEIVLLNNKHIYATATALGPAFEGVNISSGIGAIDGAIDHFTYPSYIHTINNQPPVGLCGSGLIEVVSELLKNNQINHTGKLSQTFSITKNITITKQDIRQVQLAKAAVKAGIEHLFINANVSPKDIKQLYIAGGFGQYTNPNHLISLGMIPLIFKDKVTILGNASLSGAIKYLSSPYIESYLTNHTLSIISLTTPLFQDLFVANMHFPLQE